MIVIEQVRAGSKYTAPTFRVQWPGVRGRVPADRMAEPSRPDAALQILR